MNIERHISNLKQYIKDDEIIEKDGSDFANFCKGHIDDIQAVLNELEEKDKAIDEMAGWLYGDDTCFGYGAFEDINTPEKIKEYFLNKE